MSDEPRPGTSVLHVGPSDRSDLPVALGPVVDELLDLALGGVALVVDAVMVRLDGGAVQRPGADEPLVPARTLVDAGIGAGWEAVRLGGWVARAAADLARPVAVLVLDPPLVPAQVRPITGLRALAARSQLEQRRAAAVLVDRSVRIDLTGPVQQVVARLDLDRLVADVVARVDLDVAVRRAMADLDMDGVVAQAVGSIDLDALVVAVVERLDLEGVVTVVLGRLDLAAVVAAVLDQVDITDLVVHHVNLEQVITSALDGLDLTALVLERVDLGRVVDGALDEIDLTALVMQRVDLVRVAEYVVEAIDLPEIIRESTGSVASEAVRGVRLQGIEADDAVGRTVDRLLRRRRPRERNSPSLDQAPVEPEEPT